MGSRPVVRPVAGIELAYEVCGSWVRVSVRLKRAEDPGLMYGVLVVGIAKRCRHISRGGLVVRLACGSVLIATLLEGGR